MKKKGFSLQEALVFYKEPTEREDSSKVVEVYKDLLEGEEYNNEDIIQFLLVWENNNFIESQMRELLLQESKETNIETLLMNLKQRYDNFTVSYSIYYPLYKKVMEGLEEENTQILEDKFQGIVEDLFVEFDLTLRATEQKRNREQVEQLSVNGEFTQSCREYIEDRLSELFDNDELEEDENLEQLTDTLFTAVMIAMLYMKEEPISFSSRKKFLETFKL